MPETQQLPAEQAETQKPAMKPQRPISLPLGDDQIIEKGAKLPF